MRDKLKDAVEECNSSRLRDEQIGLVETDPCPSVGWVLGIVAFAIVAWVVFCHYHPGV